MSLRRGAAAAIACALAGLAWTARRRLLRRAGGLLVVSDRLVPADAILLPYSPTRARARFAADVFRAGYGRAIYVTNLHYDVAGMPDHGTAPFTRQALIDHGVPAEAIQVIPDMLTSAHEEARVLAPRLHAAAVRRAIVVAEPGRMRRTILAYRQAFGPGIELLAAPSPSHDFSPDTWWQHRRGLHTALNEFLRLGYYLLARRSGVRWVRDRGFHDGLPILSHHADRACRTDLPAVPRES